MKKITKFEWGFAIFMSLLILAQAVFRKTINLLIAGVEISGVLISVIFFIAIVTDILVKGFK